jgi:hypothetical protein
MDNPSVLQILKKFFFTVLKFESFGAEVIAEVDRVDVAVVSGKEDVRCRVRTTRLKNHPKI